MTPAPPLAFCPHSGTVSQQLSDGRWYTLDATGEGHPTPPPGSLRYTVDDTAGWPSVGAARAAELTGLSRE